MRTGDNVKKTKSKIKAFKNYNLLILVLFIIVISIPLFYKGIIHGHDLRFHLSRIISIKEGLNNGNIFNYIYGGYLNNYGYGIGLFYSNIYIYIPSILNFIGISVINSYKIFIIICNIFTAFSMYYCMNKIVKNKDISLIAAILYLLSPYRICDIFIRAALGEILSFIFIPFILLGIYDFISNNGKNWKYLSIGFMGLILSHLISTIIFFFLTLIIFIIYYKKLLNKECIKNLLFSVGTCILIVAFYVFPMLEQYFSMQFIVNTSTVSSDISNYTIPILKTFSGISHWDNGVFIPSGISFFMIYILLLRTKLKKFKLQKICDICIIIGIITLLCTTDFLPWTSLKFLSIIQFPWRIYICSTTFLIVAVSIILNEYCNKYKNKSKKFIIFILFLAVISPMYNIFIQYKSEYLWKSYHDYNLGGKDYIPIDVNLNKLRERGEVVTSNNNINIDFTRKNDKIIIQYDENEFDDTYLELPLLYYKGYYASNNLKVEAGKNGVVRVYLGDVSGRIEVYYKGTLITFISRLISLITIIFIIIFYLLKGVRKYGKRKNFNNSSLL